MFVQVISGQAGDGAGLRRQFERWASDLRPSSTGFLGSTAGVTTDGRFVAVARFEDEQSARANSDRPEQSAWWEETERFFKGPVTFRESSDVEILARGGSDEAGSVQVIEGRTTDRPQFMDLERRLEPGFVAERPDFIGSLLVWWDDGTWVEVAYFTSEDEARAGEERGLSPQVSDVFAKWQQVAAASSFLDVTEPWLVS